MGMYTELRFFAEMPRPIDCQVEMVLSHLVGPWCEYPYEPPAHPFFECSRWLSIAKMDSYYFNADTHSSFRFDEVANSHFLTIQSNLKNYDSEIEKFIDWITPHCRGIGPLDEDGEPYGDGFPGTFMGYYRHEEDEIPTLIHHDGRKV